MLQRRSTDDRRWRRTCSADRTRPYAIAALGSWGNFFFDWPEFPTAVGFKLNLRGCAPEALTFHSEHQGDALILVVVECLPVYLGGLQWDQWVATMAEFIPAKSRRKLPGITDTESTSPESIKALIHNLESKHKAVRESVLYKKITDACDPVKFTSIRCVALGSPCQETPALYQLALLRAIAEDHGIPNGQISLFDPVFTALDEALLHDMGYIVEDVYSPKVDKDTCLFFLPHAPLSLTNTILNDQEPKHFLSNNVVTHTDRMIKTELHKKYPLLSKLVHLLEQSTTAIVDDFQPVIKRKNRKPQKNKFIEIKIDYDAVDTYFSSPSMTSFKESEEGPWINSFTDLAYHIIQ